MLAHLGLGLGGRIPEVVRRSPIPIAVRLPSGETLHSDGGAPVCRVVIKSERLLRRPLSDLDFADAYVAGQIDVEGEFPALLKLRSLLHKPPRAVEALLLWKNLVFDRLTRLNRQAIDQHYTVDELFLSFLDRDHRIYSHGLFESAGDSLEQATGRKLAYIHRALELSPGMRLLDVGAGWGGVMRYLAARGVDVTSLTISEGSYRYVQAVIEREALRARVLMEDVYDHRPEHAYDRVAIVGVIEHLPNYRRLFSRLWELIHPGGMLYFCASATERKHQVNPFIQKYIFPRPHCHLCLQDAIQELLYHGFELVEVWQDNESYRRTLQGWAERWDEARDRVIARFGEATFRVFRLYLWGGAHAYEIGSLQAYRVVARRLPRPGLRPSAMQRTVDYVRSYF